MFFKQEALDAYIDLLKILLPEILITHFDLTSHQTKEGVLQLHFEENSPYGHQKVKKKLTI